MLLCNCQLASFANLSKAILDSDEVDCDNGKTLDKVNFAGMNCVNNVDICTKDKELMSSQSVTPTISEPSFAIYFGDIKQYTGTIEVEYNITKNDNFPLANFRCEIAFSSLNQIYYETLDVCDIYSNDLQFVTVNAEEMGKYNVCVSIIDNKKMYCVECLVTEYNLTEPTDGTINEDHQTSSSTSTFHSTSTAAVHTTASITTTEDISSLSTSTSKPSTINNTFKTTTHATTSITTVKDVSSPTSASKTTTADDTSIVTSVPETSTVIPTTYDKTTNLAGNKTVSVSSTYFPTTKTKTFTTTTLPVTVQEHATVPTVTMQEYTFPTTTTFSIDVAEPSQKSPFVKSFSISRDARSQLWFSWNVTLEHPITTCTLEFSLILHSQSKNNWHTECSNGSYLLGDLNSAHQYQICVEMYWQEKLIETNCIEISPSSMLPVAASSEGSEASDKLSAAAFIALVILAVVILILIIIVLIKLVYLRRNKTNTYDVAKEEEDNQNQITKRSSNLYSVSSVEDDQV